MSELLAINVNEHTEKKNNLTYLSWAWAWAEVLKHDPEATWEAVEFAQPDGTCSPCMYMGGGSAMVKTKVTIKGKARYCLLPVMDHRNKAIQNPDAFQVNTAIMRCMTKAISMHGLGLYIYAGEDLPETESNAPVSLEVKRMGGLTGIGDDLSADWKSYLQDTAKAVTELVLAGKFDEANFEMHREPLDDTQQLYMERFLDSKTRSALRKFNSTQKAA
jgi:Protein of unknown function (DUF1071)